MGTTFAAVYDCFLGKITDDMYIEMTSEDTIRDLRALLLNAIPNFEFPKKNLNAYTIQTAKLDSIEEVDNEFILDKGEIISLIDADTVIFNGGSAAIMPPEEEDDSFLVDQSAFDEELTAEEINILAILMMIEWLQRQITSIENTRMKYSGTDFKFTSQANHLSKLLNLLSEAHRQSHHMQRLYGRRRLNDKGRYVSNWSVFKSRG